MDEKIIGLDKNKDIDRRLEETTKELQREREKLMAVIRMSGDLIFEYDIAKDQMHYAGPEEGSLYCGQITEGYTEQLLREVDNRTDAVEQQLAEALHSGKPDICIELCKTDEEGNPHWMKVIGQTFYNEKKEPERVLGKVCDIDAQKKKERELQEKSQRDSLTGLLNHSTIKQQITHRLQKMKRGQVGYLIVLDVDSFKKINDTNGHLFGDAVLCSFADEMNKLFPEALKGRIGGDEFVCYVENMPREELEEKLGQLNRCMSDRYDDDKTGLHISCSLGAAVTDGTVTDYNLLFRWADAALYQVKSREKGAYDLLEVKEGVALPGQSYLDSEENKEDEIVHKEAQFESAEDLVLFCMDLLENVPNLTSALKVISERTCSFFNIDDMICVEVNEAGPSIRYQWNREEKKNFVKRILHPGVFEWDRIRKRADESGAAIYRQSETPNIYKEEAESVMIVMSTASKGLKASVIFSDRHTDRTWEEEKNALCRISHQIFNRLRMLKNAEKDQRELNRKLNYDALTGLPVYNKFVDKLEAYMAANGKTGLYFVSSDFSNFQYVNEMYGYEGVKTLYKTIQYAKEKGMFVMTDGKRNDIGATMEAYATAHLGLTDVGGELVEAFGADALTVNGYLGSDGINPLLDQCRKYDKGIFVLVKTSNKSSGELQDLMIGNKTVYATMGSMCELWGKDVMGKYGYSGVGAVVGATYPEQLAEMRKALPHTFFLVPGYGAQGGGAEGVSKAFDDHGLGAIVNSSRGVMCAYKKEDNCDEHDFAKAARREVIRMKEDIISYLPKITLE